MSADEHLNRQQFLEHGYRVGEYEAPRRSTAGDVVRYEEEELGNHLGIPEHLRKRLDDIPAHHLTWVTKTPEDAERYGEPEHHDFTANPAMILSEDDGDGGFLVAHHPDAIRRLGREMIGS